MMLIMKVIRQNRLAEFHWFLEETEEDERSCIIGTMRNMISPQKDDCLVILNKKNVDSAHFMKQFCGL